MTRRFTGLHMAAILVTFFAVVMAVNMTMAVMASRTFGGKVVENSYVASQNFNRWLAAAQRQQASGLNAQFLLDEQRRLVLTVTPARARQGAVPIGRAEHPLGREADVPLRFVAMRPGQFRTARPVPSGRWIVRLSLATVSGEARLLEDVG